MDIRKKDGNKINLKYRIYRIYKLTIYHSKGDTESKKQLNSKYRL